MTDPKRGLKKSNSRKQLAPKNALFFISLQLHEAPKAPGEASIPLKT
jgi:hypothetical protein